MLFSKLAVQPIVAHGVKVDRLSRVLGKIFLKCIILAAYCCIEEDNFDCKLLGLPDPVSSLLEASAVGVPSLHRFRLQCNCSILSLPLYTFVVAVLTTLPWLC